MQSIDILLSRVAVLESKMEEQKDQLLRHETRHNEFMLRTDQRLEITNDGLKQLLAKANEQKGALWALGMVVTGMTIIGSAIGFVSHEFFHTPLAR